MEDQQLTESSNAAQGGNEEHGHGRGRGRLIEIFVNARPHTVSTADVSYEQVVELAFPGQTPGPNSEYIVTYTRAQHGNSAGSLTPGGRIRVKKGTSFAVQITTRS